MLTCFPLDVVRTRIMSAPIGSSPAPLTLMRTIARTEVSAGRRCRLTFHIRLEEEREVVVVW
jgi:hypothetical protein